MSQALDPVTLRHVERAADALVEEFAGVFSRETIERFVADSLEKLRGARFEAFVPALAHRFARDRLRAIGHADGTIVKETPQVLFVCVHNAGRSQMAAALLADRAGGSVEVRSAGSAPAADVNPVVVEAMREVGIDLAEAYPKPLEDEFVRAADVVITMGCGDACPVYPGKRYEDWVLDDPAGMELDGIRAVRDEIARRVDALVASLDLPV